MWQTILAGFVLMLLILLWAAGFDWVCRALSGGVIETVTGWLASAWVWAAWIFGGLVVCGMLFGKRRQARWARERGESE